VTTPNFGHPPDPVASVPDSRGSGGRRPRVCVVGSGWRFTGGISHFTCRLAGALAEEADTSAILLRRLLPTRLYPGHRHVGEQVAGIDYDPRVSVFDGIDWFWFPSLLTAITRLRARRPDVLVLQWWTGAVAHTYLVLAMVARRLGTNVVIEFHEVQDTGEVKIPLVGAYTRAVLRWILRCASGFLVHSEHDRELLSRIYDLSGRPVSTVSHGPFDHYRAERTESADNTCRLLFFGIIRPYKGLEHLVRAFDRLSAQEAARFHLTVVGETWEGCAEPIELIERSPHRERITLVNRYVTDGEAVEHFSQSDALVLPYLRSSASGPLHIAMSNGLPTVVSAVGGLVEAVENYTGAILVPPGDEAALLDAIRSLPAQAGQVHADPHSWAANVNAVLAHVPTSNAPVGGRR
jgi:glycosyltransferase involved in cell wall biosynthesis